MNKGVHTSAQDKGVHSSAQDKGVLTSAQNRGVSSTFNKAKVGATYAAHKTLQHSESLPQNSKIVNWHRTKQLYSTLLHFTTRDWTVYPYTMSHCTTEHSIQQNTLQ